MNMILAEEEQSDRASVDASVRATALNDIFIAVHGIGEQDRNSTIQAVATQLAQASSLGSCWLRPPVAPQPLGHFQGHERTAIAVTPLEFGATSNTQANISIGLAEVYWADIPRNVVREGHTLEETKAWARTVVARAQDLYQRAFKTTASVNPDTEENKSVGGCLQQAVKRLEYHLSQPDFALASEVLDQMIETIYVIENLLFLARKTGVISLDLTGVLNDFLGDVQLVTEFASFRLDIVGRFYQALENIYKQQLEAGNRDVRLHIIAHSEGTVVSFLGLLHALSGQRVHFGSVSNSSAIVETTGKIPEWASHVHSFMTIGSPIDKHLLLWNHLWTDFRPCHTTNKIKIRWRNYYDLGDPVGFRLDTARAWLAQKHYDAFEFDDSHDIGFARYLIPGKAHVDYWSDSEVFAHYLSTAAFAKDAPATQNNPRLQLEPTPPPRSRRWVSWLSPALPYLMSFFVLVLGVCLAGRVIGHYILPSLSPTDSCLIRNVLGFAPPHWDLLTPPNILGISFLITGVTLLARLPRLASGMSWKFVGAGAFLAGLLSYIFLVAYTIQREVGYLFSISAVLIVVPSVFWLVFGALGRACHKWALAGALLSAIGGYLWHDSIYPMTPSNEYPLSLAGTSVLALTVALAGLAVTRRSKERSRR